VYSSRKLEAKISDEVAFRYSSADAHPDHDTLSEFRKRHLEASASLFTQALQLCEKAGLVKLGHVSIDGIEANAGVPRPTVWVPRRSSSVGWNASKHKAMSYARMGETKHRRGFRRFSLRGLNDVRREWKLVGVASNLLKLFGSGWTPQAA
jgi:Transposase domain (DUF772)